MFSHLPRLVAMSAASLIVAAILGISALALSPEGRAMPAGSVPPQPSFSTPSVQRYPTGGPFISEGTALDKAATFARGPVTRQEAHILPYATVSSFLGSRDARIDPQRQVYFVITQAPYRTRGAPNIPGVTCGSYVTAIDATSGEIMAAGCQGIGSWPDRVPAGFSTK